MEEMIDIHSTLRLDHTVQRKNESHQHWAAKAVIVDMLRSDPAIVGEVATERKTGERIGDIRCRLSESPPDMPRNFVIEVETSASNKDRCQATSDHLRHEYAVYWVFIANAVNDRRATEEELADRVSTPPSLGVVALPDGELSLGEPITWDGFDYQSPWLARAEFRIPTYDRWQDWYCHGDFEISGERMAILHQSDPGRIYTSTYIGDGQQTLPEPAEISPRELQRRIQEDDIVRTSPVRGPP